MNPILVPENATRDRFMALARDVLKLIGAALLAHGMIRSSWVEPMVGVGMALASVLWSQRIVIQKHLAMVIMAQASPDAIAQIKPATYDATVNPVLPPEPLDVPMPSVKEPAPMSVAPGLQPAVPDHAAALAALAPVVIRSVLSHPAINAADAMTIAADVLQDVQAALPDALRAANESTRTTADVEAGADVLDVLLRTLSARPQ